MRPRLASAVALLVAAAAAPAAEPTFEAAVLKKGPALHELFKKKGYRSVGVLKFLVREGTDGKLSDNVGDLNLALANKTETAIGLTNTDHTFGIVNRASAAADESRLTAANHLTKEGRTKFFERKWELAYSQDPVYPGGFVTGEVTIRPDSKTMLVQLQVFDKTGEMTDVPDPIEVSTGPGTLAMAGRSYSVPKPVVKALVTGQPTPRKVSEEAVEAIRAAAAAPPPAKDEPFAPLADAPVKLTVLYNRKPVAVSNRGVVPEPEDTDEVWFKLENPGPEAYAVVLLVNGQNTLYNETLSPDACRKWVLPAGAEVTVTGFQTDADTAVAFRVTKPGEVVDNAVRYGPHAGTFRFVVFAGKLGTEPAKAALPDADLVAVANTRGTPVPGHAKPMSLRAYQRDLRGRSEGGATRGYVVKGTEARKSETEAVTFVPEGDAPVTDVSLKYIVPKN